MDQLIYASLSHTHYWYEVGMLKVLIDFDVRKSCIFVRGVFICINQENACMVTHHLVRINRVRLPILLVVQLNRENEYFPVPVRIRARDSMTRFSLDVESERAWLTSKFSGANGNKESS